MSAIIFPPSPALYDIFSSGSRQWQWDGSVWNAVVSTSGYVGTGSIYSANAPLSPTAGMRWTDTNTLLTYAYYGNAWVEVENVGLAQMPAGSVLQTLYVSLSTGLYITATMPWNTLPAITDGTQILSQSIYPSSSASKILARVSIPCLSIQASNIGVFSIYRDSNCIRTGFTTGEGTYGDDKPYAISLEIMDSPNTTSAINYTVRCGAMVGYHIYVNKTSTGSFGGGSVESSLLLQEIKG